MDEEVSWGRFFTGCLILIVLGACGAGAFYYFGRSAEEQRSVLERDLFSPYWELLQNKQFERACDYWVEQTPEKLRASYQKIETQHGNLTKASVVKAIGTRSPGQQAPHFEVRTKVEFSGGHTDFVSYEAVQTKDGWKISVSRVKGSSLLGDGPY
ncbi:MAG: hypothetical protein WC314_27385 [Vulcanimicrobiota bacterium]